MQLSEYLNGLKTLQSGGCSGLENSPEQWFRRLSETVARGQDLYEQSPPELQERCRALFQSMVRTEELKAWYGTPEGEALFQGTSISSLTIPETLSAPLEIRSIAHLEELIADAYIRLHDRYEQTVRDAILEDVEPWLREGLFYGFVLPSKVVSQAFNLAVPHREVIFNVRGVTVDPHEILSCPADIREDYFRACRDRIGCFAGLDITRTEFEESLILADISKPKINTYRDKLLLGPVKCNELCALIARHVAGLVKGKTNGRISPPSLMATIYDTDTPYTYHRAEGWLGSPMAPTLPGLVVLGASGTIDAFRWLYAYRVSLIAQKMMKGSLYSQVKKEYVPFVFFGVLVPRDAEILLDMNRLSMLRYRGNLSPLIEFCYLMPRIAALLETGEFRSAADDLKTRLC